MQTDDPGVVEAVHRSWHPRLPPPPREFPQTASFALTRAEAAFVQELWVNRCRGTLLAWLASARASPALTFETLVRNELRSLRALRS